MKDANGVMSTEFWLTVVMLVCATVLFFFEKISVEVWKELVYVLVPAYALSRGITKVGSKKKDA